MLVLCARFFVCDDVHFDSQIHSFSMYVVDNGLYCYYVVQCG